MENNDFFKNYNKRPKELTTSNSLVILPVHYLIFFKNSPSLPKRESTFNRGMQKDVKYKHPILSRKLENQGLWSQTVTKLTMQCMHCKSICTVILASQNCPLLHAAFSAYFACVKVAAIFKQIYQTWRFTRDLTVLCYNNETEEVLARQNENLSWYTEK